MAGCNCKSDKKIDELLVNDKQENKKLNDNITSYFFKILGFIFLIALLPIINLFIIWFIFRTLVLNKNVNIKPLLLAIGQKFQQKDEVEDDEYIDDLTEDDVIVQNVEDITKK